MHESLEDVASSFNDKKMQVRADRDHDMKDTPSGNDIDAALEPPPPHSSSGKTVPQLLGNGTLRVLPLQHATRNASLEPDFQDPQDRRSQSPFSFSGVSIRNMSLSPASPLPYGFQVRMKMKALDFWGRNRGLIMVALAQFFNVLMNVAARMMEVEGNEGKGFHPFHILFARMGATFVFSSAYMWWAKTEHFPFGLKEVRWLLFLRSFGGFFGVFGMYYSLLYLPLADATVITFLAPSLSCWVCSFVLKDQPFTRLEQIGTYISLFGVMLIARPTFLFASSTAMPPPATGIPDGSAVASDSTDSPPSLPSHSDYSHISPSQRLNGVLIGLVGVLGATCAYTTLRCIGTRAHPLLSVNYYAAWTTFVCLMAQMLIPSVGFLLPRTIKDISMLVFMGFSGFIMQFLLAAGLQAEKSSRATNMVYLQMLFAMGLDKLVFGTTPTALSLTGSGLILGSAMYVALHKDRSRVKVTGSDYVHVGDEERGLVDRMDAEDGEVILGERQDVPLQTLR